MPSGWTSANVTRLVPVVVIERMDPESALLSQCVQYTRFA